MDVHQAPALRLLLALGSALPVFLGLLPVGPLRGLQCAERAALASTGRPLSKAAYLDLF